MREILFRGKRLHNEHEWVYGSLMVYHYHGKEGTAYMIYIPSGDYRRVIPETVGQFTGMTDRNGTKIFEGDIIETYEDYDDIFGYPATDVFNSVVIWDKKNFCYALKTGNCIQSFNDWDWDNSCVIGNVYDNPDLLEGGG